MLLTVCVVPAKGLVLAFALQSTIFSRQLSSRRLKWSPLLVVARACVKLNHRETPTDCFGGGGPKTDTLIIVGSKATVCIVGNGKSVVIGEAAKQKSR